MNTEADALPWDEAAKVVDVVRRVLGDGVVGAYLHGSSVVGGLRPDSDLDVLVAVRHGVTGADRRRLVDGLLEVSGRHGEDVSEDVRGGVSEGVSEGVSKDVLGGVRGRSRGPRPVEVTVVVRDDVVPWRFPPVSDLVYGEWLREEFEAGKVPAPGPDPDLAILLAGVREHGRTLVGPPARELFAPVPDEDVRRAIADSLPDLLHGLRGDDRNVVLTLARMWVTLSTGEIVPKDVAARWVRDRLPAEHRPVLDLARDAYVGERADDWSGLVEDVDAFAEFAAAMIAGLARGE
ncbi:aminoglycoside adenylyltransferase family protein [Streptomyces sp. NPDC003077]|uniref:aminoglycoside adenylyltransferase family protein n=1 Tax=Streptomyces sp. NPDC003077 TaxID=3154443 RepID=UPI0033B8E5A0